MSSATIDGTAAFWPTYAAATPRRRWAVTYRPTATTYHFETLFQLCAALNTLPAVPGAPPAGWAPKHMYALRNHRASKALLSTAASITVQRVV